MVFLFLKSFNYNIYDDILVKLWSFARIKSVFITCVSHYISDRNKSAYERMRAVAIELYEHNMDAYKSALQLLDITGKAAIIHPTGTGKSFIGFKYAEDNPDKHIVWLTPSEYIVKTQLENLVRESGAKLTNITFITYAKLMLMNDEELRKLKTDTIICDELHRIGAEKWQMGFENLVRVYPNAGLLGFSATNIRYLDNQRDMAEEIFDGNIASHITLGEAIVRGILVPPKYVLSVFSYNKELEKYKKRVENSKSKAVRDAGEKYLEALRRALDKADGINEIFNKHIEEKTGKYIVFCANLEHMNEMMDISSEWFKDIDENPHIYSAYSNNPETSRAFMDFKADTSEHLKLLFCIDMLNEGIHVDDISGVILLRPTVSPIIYKQQIGRALAVGKKKNTVIFDIVQNFENLYSIGDIKEEMNEIIRFYQSTGEEYEIVNDAFNVIDNVRDCKKLFDELEHTLNASWNCMYNVAKEYYKEHGNLLPRQKYTNDDGYRLGQWIVTQRTAYANGKLSSSRALRLEQIGMDWHNVNERQWEENFNKAKAHYDKYGNLNVNKSEYSMLRNWINKQRIQYRKGLLPDDRYMRLSEIGMVWEFEDCWMARYEEAKKYFEKYENLDIPADYVSESGANLGRWYRNVRKQYLNGVLSDDRRHLLEEIGIDAVSVKIRTWMNFYNLAKKYYSEHGNLRIGIKYTVENGTKLGVWISGQRYMYSKGKLKKEQIKLLEDIGMEWHRDKSRWETGFMYAEQYYGEYKHLNPEADYVTDDGFALGRWIATQRKKYKDGKISGDRIARLDELEIIWDMSSAKWETGFKYLCEYNRYHGDISPPGDYVTDDGFMLGNWTANQRSRYKAGKLSGERIDKLNNLGFIWDLQKVRWQEQYACAKAYFECKGNISVSKDYVTDKGFKLRYWIDSQKKAYKKGNLDKGQIMKLGEIGIV